MSTDTGGKPWHALSENEPTGSSEKVSSFGATVPLAGRGRFQLTHTTILLILKCIITYVTIFLTYQVKEELSECLDSHIGATLQILNVKLGIQCTTLKEHAGTCSCLMMLLQWTHQSRM